MLNPETDDATKPADRNGLRWKLIQRRWIWIGTASIAVVAAVVAGVLVWRANIPQSQPATDCQVARAMIDYNKSQSRSLAKAFDPEQGKEASVSDYQNWASQMQGYASRIKAPDIAAHAQRLADEANQLTDLVKQARSDTSVPADPGAPPAWAQPYADLSKRFHSELTALNKACPNH